MQSNIRFTWFEIIFQVQQVLMCTCSPLAVLNNDFFSVSNRIRMTCHLLQLCSMASTHTFHGTCHVLILVALSSEVYTSQHVTTPPSVQGCHVQLLLKEP